MLEFGEEFSVQSASDAEFTAPSQYALTSPANGQMRVTAADVAERRAGGSTAALAIADRQSLPPGTLVLTYLRDALDRSSGPRHVRPAFRTLCLPQQ